MRGLSVLPRPRGNHILKPNLSGEGALDCEHDIAGPAQFIFVIAKNARNENCIEGHTIGGCENLRIDDIGPRCRAGTGDDRQKPRMIGGNDRELGDAPVAIRVDMAYRRGHLDFGHIQQFGVQDLLFRRRP